MIKQLKTKKAEGYLDVSVTILLVAFVLVFFVNIVSVVALNQNLKAISDQLVDHASQNGTTDVSAYAAELSEKTGIAFSYSFAGSETIDGTNHVQLGDKLECTVYCSVNILGFGGEVHGFNIKASASGTSRVYYK